MDNVKISLTISLPGAVMESEQNCKKFVWKETTAKNGKKLRKKVLVDDFAKTEKFHFNVTSKEKGQKPSTEHYTILIRKSIPAKQAININEEAYNYYISKFDVPSFTNKFVWDKMSKKERLEAHLKNIADGLGGEVLDYHVFED